MVDQPEVLLAGAPLVQFAIGVGLSWLAGKLLSGDQDRLDNDKPTTLSKRGSYISWFLGVRRVAPVFCAAHGRYSRKERQKSGGKGSALAPKVEVWYESGWHALAVGPCDALHKILQGGKAIYTGPITPDSHPSGSLISAGDEGEFRIYWGESSQPVDADLAAYTTINSRYPDLCYVYWVKKRLGQSPTWPVLDYELERRPVTTELTTDGWVEPTLTLTGETVNIADEVHGSEGSGYFQLEGDHVRKFYPTSSVFLSGNTMASGQYEVLKSETALIAYSPPRYNWNGVSIFRTVTRVYLVGGVDISADTNGSLQLYESDGRRGCNIAHAVTDLINEPWPRGLGLDLDDVDERWDRDSLQAFADEAASEQWVSSLYAQNGEKANGLLTSVMQDHGYMLPLGQRTGAWEFTPVRVPLVADTPNLGDDIWADELPEITTIHAEPTADRLVFTFKDREYDYGDMTISVDDDGVSGYAEFQKARKVPIVSTTDFVTASALSELRAPEELATASEIKLSVTRGGRGILPGTSVTAYGFDYNLRVMEVEIDPDADAVVLTCLPDWYGVPMSDLRIDSGGGKIQVLPAQNEEQFFYMEVPEQLLPAGLGSQQTLLPLHIRATDQTSQVAHWLSADNSTYEFNSYDTFFQAGGTLDSELSGDAPAYEAQSVTFTEVGPDNSTLTQDLSADDPNYFGGRQLAVIISDNGVEICLLRKATVTVPGTRRLDGLMRGRYDTRKITHNAGAQIYIFDPDVAQPLQDLLLQPDAPLYLKTQSDTLGGSVDLSSIASYGQALYGKGQRPIKPQGVRVEAPYAGSPSYAAGSDLVLAPLLFSGTSNTGAGGGLAGSALGDPVIPGVLEVSVGSLTYSVVPGESLTVPSADLASIGDPSSLDVTVTHTANGYVSTPSDIVTISKI
jgi:hypothetical protein